MEKRGVIFVASGEKYIEEVRDSLKRLKSVVPEINTTFYTDRNVEIPEADEIIVEKELDRDYSAKIKKMNDSPYEKTIFLDSEVKVAEDFSEIFEVLDDFQMAFAFKNGRIQGKSVYKMDMSYNTGVIAYKDDEQVQDFFSDWLEAYKMEKDEYHDQTTFFNKIVKSDIRYMTLPFEYNYRLQLPSMASGRVKIFHFRESEVSGLVFSPSSVDDLMKKVNSYIGRRVSYIKRGKVRLKTDYSRKELLSRVYSRINKDGVKQTLITAKKRLKSGDELFK